MSEYPQTPETEGSQFGPAVVEKYSQGELSLEPLNAGDAAIIDLSPSAEKYDMPLHVAVDEVPYKVLATISVGKQEDFSGGTSQRDLEGDLARAASTLVAIRGAYSEDVHVVATPTEAMQGGNLHITASQLSKPVDERGLFIKTALEDEPGAMPAKTWIRIDRGSLLVDGDDTAQAYTVVVQGNNRKQ